MRAERFRREARCPVTGKIIFGTRWAANGAAEHAEADSDELYHAYPCYGCGSWHIGHATLWDSAALRLVEYALRMNARERAEQIPDQLAALVAAGR